MPENKQKTEKVRWCGLLMLPWLQSPCGLKQSPHWPFTNQLQRTDMNVKKVTTLQNTKRLFEERGRLQEDSVIYTSHT